MGYLAAARGVPVADSNLFAKADLAGLWRQAGDGSMSLAVGFDIVIAMPLSWLPLIADYSRFGQRASRVFGGTALGFSLAMPG